MVQYLPKCKINEGRTYEIQMLRMTRFESGHRANTKAD